MADLLLDKVLVTTDLSQESESAIRAVLPLCKTLGAGTTLLHVSEVASDDYAELLGRGGAAQSYRDEIRRMLLDELEAMRRRHFPGDSPDARVVLIEGHPVWKAVCDYAAQHGYGLIALATHGRSGVARWLIGSVAERIAAHAHCPVMTVRPTPVA